MEKELLNVFLSQLESHYTRRELGTIYQELKHFQVFDRLPIDKIIARLKNNEPYQYIAGKAYFYDFELFVNANTLIPRPETEELVYWIIQEEASSASKILDIGTGSGCIALALAKHIPTAQISALDTSSEALEVVEKNANALGLDIERIHADILNQTTMPDQYDVIVSNPPYIPHAETKLMHQNVLDFEPHLALFVDNEDPLIFYRKIAELATKTLTSEGALYFECNEYNASDVQEMLRLMDYTNIELRQDMQAKDRMIRAQKNKELK